jgi:hypothetical protein
LAGLRLSITAAKRAKASVELMILATSAHL